MKTIWKYPITLEPIQEIEMQKGAEILTFHKQGSRHEDEMYIWCLVHTKNEKEKRTFLLVSTGDLDIPEKAEYVGTIWLLNGSHVIHLLELKKG
jgi:hypothetical protein